jgi:peptide/nickel transport system permease protein
VSAATWIARGALRRRPRSAAASPLPVAVAVAVGVVLLVAFLAVFGSLLVGSGLTQHLADASRPPSGRFWLGTDGLGRDIFERVIVGTRTALLGPAVVALTGAIGSSILGIASGYLGGAVDLAISRAVDFMFALPGLLIAIVVVAVVGGGYWIAVAVLCVLNVQGDIRIVRSAAAKQRPLTYIEAARALDIPVHRIMYVHILRNIVPILIADLVLDFGGALVALAGLAFLGLGSSLGSPEWGLMLAEGKEILFLNPAAALAPAVAIVSLAISANLIGDWIYDRHVARGQR